ncbi:MAG: bifunctional N-acetylglucosamine-1-phosphate uridyltransferase/glucosamine-1-phosphate acetyltransferase [Candidatus Electrothrix sp. GM3_4]|nr:bifunctional N-acetylglucosamine-1-phosphate uridyltransferase/glucosamine-1-phosphate acetyltransferase [Candidatus Electrothrix sp. GM3_4]
MSSPNISAVILAAGKGTRMKSDQAKVLHELFFKPMLHHVLDSVAATDIEHIAVIVGHQRERVLGSLQEAPTPYQFTPVVQEEQLGTGHAVLCAESACKSADLVMILCGDTPLIRSETLQAMIDRHQESKAVLTLMTTVLDDPFGYGRIMTDADGGVVEIVEQKDANEEQRTVREVNAGIYLVNADFLFSVLRQVGTDNSQGEVYLTDIVSIARQQGHRVGKFVHTPAIDVLGVNSRVELAQAHHELQMRHNREVMLSGVTMYGPGNILISPDCQVGQDAVLHAGVQITGSAKIGSRVQIASGAVLHSCQVSDKAVIGANSVLRNCTVQEGEQVLPLTSRLS